MFKSNDEHREALVKAISEYVDQRYISGSRDHGGHLWRKNVLPHAIEEAIDQCVYLFTKREQENLLYTRLDLALGCLSTNDNDAAYNAVMEAMNILTIGNPEGIEEEELEG